MNLLDLFVKISADDSGLDEKFKAAEKKTSALGGALKKGIETATKVVTTGIAAGTTFVAGLTTMAVNGFAAYEQLSGGVETLFKDSAGKVEAYAKEAYKTAGMNANDYMETVTGFSASLLQSLGGDTEKAAEYANRAIKNMSDNSNKMGTSMESIENAYRGFSRQNFTMLDNLSLGFSGSKEGMQQLLDKAEELSGIKYDISSYADIIDAIEVVQDEMGITGTTAKEAATTIEGSANSMKAAWSNVITGMATGNTDLSESIGIAADATLTFADNVIPRIQTALDGAGQAFEILVPKVLEVLPRITSEILPGMANAVQNLLLPIGQAVVDYAPTLLQNGIDTAINLVNGLSSGVAQAIPEFIGQALPMIADFSENLRSNASQLIDSGLALIENVADGLVDGIPALIENVPEIVSNLAGVINDNATKVLISAGKIMITLGKGLIENIPKLIENIPEIITAVVDVFLAFNWLNLGKNIISGLGKGIKAMGGTAKNAASSIFNTIKGIFTDLPGTLKGLGSSALNLLKGVFSAGKSQLGTVAKMAFQAIVSEILTMPGKLHEQATNAVDFVKNAFNLDWGAIGKNVIDGIKNGISNGVGALVESVKTAANKMLSAAKEALGIHSPSKRAEKEVGEMYGEGIVKGVRNKITAVKQTSAELAAAMITTAKEKADKLTQSGKLTQAGLVGYWRTVTKAAKAELSETSKTHNRTVREITGQSKKLDESNAQWEKKKKACEENVEALKKLQAAQKTAMEGQKKNTESYKSAKAAYAATTQKIKDAQTQLKKEKEAHTANTKELKENIKTLQTKAKEEEKALKAIDSARSQYYKAVKKLNSEVAKIDKQYAKDQKTIKDNLIKNIQSVVDAYDKAVADRQAAITKQMKLMESVEYNEKIAGADLIASMKSQAEAAEAYDHVMDSLADKKGMTAELYDSLKDIGIEDTETLMSIANMTDKEFADYVKLFERRQAAALDRSRNEHEALKTQSEAQIKELTDQADKDLKALEKQYKKDLKALGVTATDESAGIGKNIVKGLIKGIKSENSQFQKELKAFFKSIETTAKDTLDVHSPSRIFEAIGNFVTQGLGNGILEKASGVIQIIKDLASGVIENFDLGEMVDNAKDAAGKLQGTIKGLSASGSLGEISSSLNLMRGSMGIVQSPAMAAEPVQVNLSINIDKFENRTEQDINELANILANRLTDVIDERLAQKQRRAAAAYG